MIYNCVVVVVVAAAGRWIRRHVPTSAGCHGTRGFPAVS